MTSSSIFNIFVSLLLLVFFLVITKVNASSFWSRLSGNNNNKVADDSNNKMSFHRQKQLSSSIDTSKLNIMIICSSRARRCLPEDAMAHISAKTGEADTNTNTNINNNKDSNDATYFFNTDLASLIANENSRLFLIFTDVRSAEAAKFTISRATKSQKKLSAFVVDRQSATPLQKLKHAFYSSVAKASIVPCDITDITGSPSILSCMAEAVYNNKNTNNINNDERFLFISGQASNFPESMVNPLYEALDQNNLAGVTCLTMLSSSASSSSSSSSSIVFSAGFSKSPKYKSTLGGKLISLLPNQVGLASDDGRLGSGVVPADSIDFTASLITSTAFFQSVLHPPLPFERIVEWCPSTLDEISELLANVTESFFYQQNNNDNKNSIVDDEYNENQLNQIQRAIQWLEGLDSDNCRLRTRFGLRFDEMFIEPISPAMMTSAGNLDDFEELETKSSSSSSSSSSIINYHHELANTLLYRISSLLNDITVQSQIVQGMEAVAESSSNMNTMNNNQQQPVLASLSNVRVSVDSASTSATFSFPSSTALNRLNAFAAKGSNTGAVVSSQQYRNAKFPLIVVWDQYCCHCCGFSSEIERYVLPLTFTVYLTSHISCFCTGQIAYERLKLEDMYLTPERLQAHPTSDVLIWISHTQPYLFTHPLQEVHPVDYHIARMMFEWSRIETNWVNDIKSSVNEVWVPGEWVKQVFIQSGVPASKLFVIPEAVDTHRFSPDAVKGFADIDAAAVELGWNIHCTKPKNVENNNQHFIFFSNYKWEPRKGWETLLESYVRFGDQHPHLAARSSLYILTFAFEARNAKDQEAIFLQIDRWWEERKEQEKKNYKLDPAEAKELEMATEKRKREEKAADIKRHHFKSEIEQREYEEEVRMARRNATRAEWTARMPRLCLVVDIIPDDQMDRLYASADAFVLPTRGEGWGLPIIQSMSLGKPAIATRWGGELEFMNDDVSFFIELDGLEQPEGSTMPPGSKWAVPSAAHLTEIMAFVVQNPDVARQVGRRAREHIVARFSDEAVRRIVERRLSVIHDFVASLYR